MVLFALSNKMFNNISCSKESLVIQNVIPKEYIWVFDDFYKLDDTDHNEKSLKGRGGPLQSFIYRGPFNLF